MKWLFFSIFLFNINLCYSQWESTGGPQSDIRTTNVFEYDSDKFLSVSGCGLYKNSKDQNNWDLEESFWFVNQTLKGDSLYANVHYSQQGVFGKSGIHYYNMKDGFGESILISEVNFNIIRYTDSFLYATSGSGVKRLNFDGSEVVSFHDGLPDVTGTVDIPGNPTFTYYPVNAFVLQNGHIFCGTDDGMYAAKEGEFQFEEINNGIIPGEVGFVETLNGVLYCTVGSTLYRSSNLGNEWTIVKYAGAKIISIDLNESSIYMTTNNQDILISDDLGESWTESSLGIQYSIINQIKKVGNDLVCLTSRHGLLKFESDLWINENEGISCSFVRSLETTETNLVACTWSTLEKYSSNSGWKNISLNIELDFLNGLASMGGNLFLSGINSELGPAPNYFPFILYSSDGGVEWQKIDLPPFLVDDAYNMKTEGDRLFAIEDDRLSYSDDLGKSWTNFQVPQEYCNRFNDVLVYNSNIFAATCTDGELHKIDENDNWIEAEFMHSVDYEFYRILRVENYLLAITKRNNFYRSDNEGDDWIGISKSVSKLGTVNDFVTFDSFIFIATSNGVFYSSDFGLTWIDFNLGLKNKIALTITKRNNTLYIGTFGSGVWQAEVNFDDLIVTESKNDNRLLKVLPNPAYDYLTLMYDYPNNIDIHIFDNMGRNVLNIYSWDRSSINIENLIDGVYFVNAVTIETSLTQKVIIQKY